ncbi:MAG: sigma 54-interacting transcriptional regulator [Spirochaetales bacterium]|nr:sigma 54-interacting transcriptional regulator [Spirochaetales bacterium]
MIVFIAPYQGLKKIADEVIRDYGFPVKSCLGNLSDGLAIARTLEEQGRTLFISRGGTAQLLRENLSSQVIGIRISFLDLLEVFKEFIGTGRKIGVVGFPSLVEPSRAICRTLSINAAFYEVKNENEVFSKIDQIRKDGIDFIVGDVISVKIAEKYKIDFHLIESGPDSVREGIEKALAIQSNIKMELEKLGKIRAIFNTVKDGILSVDAEGRIEQYNAQALDYLIINRESESIKGESILSFIPESDIANVIRVQKESYGRVFPVKGQDYAFYTSPIMIEGRAVGAVTVFQPVKELQKIENRVRRQLHQKGLYAKYTFDDFIVKAQVMKTCIETGRRYSLTGSNILIIGATGTGKELMAQSIHNSSGVKDGPFVALNCGALPPQLMESELFGYVEGAFTGALKGGKTGLIELAHNGTLFLDEINSLNVDLQSRLLRVIQEREIMKIGDNKVVPVSVRIISAANASLKKEIKEGRFREDLYYRLNVLDLKLPPLKEREGDLFLLFNHFLKKYSRAYSLNTEVVLNEACRTLMKNHTWPGNIRELENWAEKCVALGSMGEVSLEEHFPEIEEVEGEAHSESTGSSGTLAEIEARIIEKILLEEDGNISRTAARLGIDRNTLKRKIR